MFVTRIAVAKPVINLWFSYVYGSSSSSAMHDNLGFREMVYDVPSPYFEPLHQFFYDHVFADEQPNPTARVFYDLMRQEERELYLGSDYATPLYTNARLLNLKISHNIVQIIFDEFVFAMKIIVPRENKLPNSN